MNNSLRSSIDELGGKHGFLEWGRDNGLSDFLVPQEILTPGEAYSEKVAQRVLRAMEAFGTGEVIVRTSEKSDWEGMVDTMPTEVCNLRELAEVVEQVREQCFDPDLIAYAETEGSDYDPGRVTVSIAPYIPQPHGTLTEHPNQPGVSLMDIFTTKPVSLDEIILKSDIPYHIFGRYSEGKMVSISRTDKFDFQGEKVDEFDLSYASLVKNILQLQLVVRLVNFIREKGIDLDDEALQFEFGFHPKTKQPLLFQSKFFAKKQLSDFQLDEADGFCEEGSRIFGFTHPEGITLPIAKKESRSEAIRKGEFKFAPRQLKIEGDRIIYVDTGEEKKFAEDWMRDHRVEKMLAAQGKSQELNWVPRNEPYLLAPEWITNQLSLSEIAPNMLGYIPGAKTAGSLSLAHQNTRFVQATLKKDGFSILNNFAHRRFPEENDEEDLIPAKITCDGRAFRIEAV